MQFYSYHHIAQLMTACKICHPVPWDFIYIALIVSIDVVVHVLANIPCPLDCMFPKERDSVHICL